MKPGGTFNTKVFQNDLNEIQGGQAPTHQLLQLPLTATFKASGATTPYGARPDLRTTSGRNPIVGNGVQPIRIPLQQPCNSIQLVWQALDPNGNYVCSYPLNSLANVDATPTPSWPVSQGTTANPNYWGFGWMRLNGLGPWFAMSLLPSHGTAAGYLSVYPFGGFSSINAPMSFVDWIGYWDGLGDLTTGPNGGNAYLLAMATSNLSVSSAGASIGQVNNYATPSGSGPESGIGNYDSTRSQDVLVKAGNNGR